MRRNFGGPDGVALEVPRGFPVGSPCRSVQISSWSLRRKTPCFSPRGNGLQGTTPSGTSKQTFDLRPAPSTWWKRASNLVQENIKHTEKVRFILVHRCLVAQLSHISELPSCRPARAGAVLRILCMRKQLSFPQLQTSGFHAKLKDTPWHSSPGALAGLAYLPTFSLKVLTCA